MSLLLNPDVAPDACACCDCIIAKDEPRLTMKVKRGNVPLTLQVCRQCLEERAPEMLLAMEAAK